MKKNIELIIKQGRLIDGGTFRDCTYTVHDSSTGKKVLNIFHKDNNIYDNNADNIKIEECFNDITGMNEIEITLEKETY